MADQTANLQLPFIAAAQAQKHVTHNEALLALDVLVQLCVIRDDWSAPPQTANEGDRYLVAAGATGLWAGQSNAIAVWQSGAWGFHAPVTGWLCHIASTGLWRVYNAGAWGALAINLQNLPCLGIGATADAANPLTVKANAALFAALETASGGTGDLRFRLNKEAAVKTVSQLYQTGWSGRAETGLIGDDHFHIKVSPDGAAWREAALFNAATGAATFPQGIVAGDRTGFRNLLRNAGFAINQRGVSGTVTLAAGAYGHDGVKAGASGATYTFTATGIDTILSLSAGSLILPVENGMIEGGIYRLAHEGTAQARVWQGAGFTGSGAYAPALRIAGGQQVNGLTGAMQTNVEFSVGTIIRPQFEPGSVATSFERRPISIEMLVCNRYYETGTTTFLGYCYGGFTQCANAPFSVLKRAIPTITASLIYGYNIPANQAPSNIQAFKSSFYFAHTPSANGSTMFIDDWAASAEI